MRMPLVLVRLIAPCCFESVLFGFVLFGFEKVAFEPKTLLLCLRIGSNDLFCYCNRILS